MDMTRKMISNVQRLVCLLDNEPHTSLGVCINGCELTSLVQSDWTNRVKGESWQKRRSSDWGKRRNNRRNRRRRKMTRLRMKVGKKISQPLQLRQHPSLQHRQQWQVNIVSPEQFCAKLLCSSFLVLFFPLKEPALFHHLKSSLAIILLTELFSLVPDHI